MKRQALIATFAFQLTVVTAGSAWAAPVDSVTGNNAPAFDPTTMQMALARLGDAMARVLPATIPAATSPPAKLPATSSVQRCADGALPPAIVRKMVADEAARQKVDVKLAETIAAQESGFGANVNSPAAAAAGAMGVMQLIAATAAQYHVVDRCEVVENVRGGVSLIGDLSARFGGNVFLILAAYNAGEGRVTAAKGVPPNSETVRYVAAGANAYYDFAAALKPKEQASPDAPGAALGDPRTPSTDSVGQKWIGGSVLYVEQEKTP